LYRQYMWFLEKSDSCRVIRFTTIRQSLLSGEVDNSAKTENEKMFYRVCRRNKNILLIFAASKNNIQW